MNEETNSAEESIEEDVTEEVSDVDDNEIESVDKIEFEDEDSKP